MDKEFQLKILRSCAKIYPQAATGLWDEFVREAPGETGPEKTRALVAHLMALQEFGYITDFTHGTTVDRRLLSNRAFRITAQGLVEAGEDILRPDPYAELRDALLKQADALRTLSPQDEKTLRSVLSSLPRVALERLRDKGLDALLALVLP